MSKFKTTYQKALEIIANNKIDFEGSSPGKKEEFWQPPAPINQVDMKFEII